MYTTVCVTCEYVHVRNPVFVFSFKYLGNFLVWTHPGKEFLRMIASKTK